MPCHPHWPKSGGGVKKNSLLDSLAEFVPHFQNRGAAPAFVKDMTKTFRCVFVGSQCSTRLVTRIAIHYSVSTALTGITQNSAVYRNVFVEIICELVYFCDFSLICFLSSAFAAWAIFIRISSLVMLRRKISICSSNRIQDTHQEMRYPNVTSLYFATPLAFNAPNGAVPLGRSP